MQTNQQGPGVSSADRGRLMSEDQSVKKSMNALGLLRRLGCEVPHSESTTIGGGLLKQRAQRPLTAKYSSSFGGRKHSRRSTTMG